MPVSCPQGGKPRYRVKTTSSHATAKRIARDHLAEDPHYYTKLKTIHPD